MSITRRRVAQLLSGVLALGGFRSGGAVVPRRRIGLIGVPINSSGNDRGVARAPAVLRSHGLLVSLATVGDVKDFGDVRFAKPTETRDPKSGIVSIDAAITMVGAVHDAVTRIREEGRFPIIIGGDCSIMLGGLSACRDAIGRTGLLFVDGHEDAYPPRASPTGEIADMEFAFAVGHHLEELPPAFARRFPAVQPADAVIIGARDTADLEHDHVQSVAPDIRVLADAVVQKSSVSTLAKREEDRLLTAGVNGVWLHTDLDVLSTASLPAVDYQQPGGFSWRQLSELSRTVVQNPATLGWDVTIYNPDLDPRQVYASDIVRLIVEAVRA